MKIQHGKRVKPQSGGWRKAVIFAVVLLVLIVGGGILYVYMGWGEAPPPKSAPAQQKPLGQLPAPKKQAANAPASAAVQSMTTPVAPGANAVLIIRTNQQGTCEISVKYGDVPAVDSGLVKKQADDYGTVTWSWTVSPSAPEGSYEAWVTCAKNGKTAKVWAPFKVDKKAAITQ